MGVIDILITWDSYKRAERLIKSVQHDRCKISAVPPDMYAGKFFIPVSSPFHALNIFFFFS